MAINNRKRKAEYQHVKNDHLSQDDIDTGIEDDNGNEGGGEIPPARQISQPSLPNKYVRLNKSRITAQKKAREDTETFAKTESQKFTELVKHNSKERDSTHKDTKSWVNFKKSIETRHEQLISKIRGKEAQLISQCEEFGKEFSSAYSRICLTYMVNQNNNQEHGSHLKSPICVLQQDSLDVIERAWVLIAQFQSCSTQIASQEISMLTNGNWEGGVKKVKQILDIGRQIGERKAAFILSSSQVSLLDSEATEVSELLYGDDLSPAHMVTWANVARKQEKRVVKLVNILAQDRADEPRLLYTTASK